jgi:hypothetical protein
MALLTNTTKIHISADRSVMTEQPTRTISTLVETKQINNTFQFDIYEAHEARHTPNMFIQNTPLTESNHQLGYKFVIDRSKPTLSPADANKLVQPTEEFLSKIARPDLPPKMYNV